MPIEGQKKHVLGNGLSDQLMIERVLVIGMDRQVTYFQHMPFGQREALEPLQIDRLDQLLHIHAQFAGSNFYGDLE